jgi:uncharacterized protein (TIGR02453 family)
MEFSGFPKNGLQFLNDLSENNNRDWFEAHKSEYQSYLLEPAQAFVTALGTKLQAIAKVHYDTRTDGRGTLMRIYRDTRFSKNKEPYKTSIGGKFWGFENNKNESPSFGFHLNANEIGLMAGMFQFSPPILQAYRDAVANDKLGSELEDILDSVISVGNYEINHEYFKRVPIGYDAKHKRSKLLRHNALYVHTKEIGPDVLETPKLVEKCFEHFNNMYPVYKWLDEVVRGIDKK